MKIIGIAGTNGSGKDTIGEMLAEQGWLFISVSELLRDEARRRGLSTERENLRTISADWRRQYGLGVLVDKAVELFNISGDKYKGLIVGPMRNPGEAQRVKDLSGQLVWVDADSKIRYQRISGRSTDARDQKTYQEFLDDEDVEMSHSGDEATLSMAAVKAKADIFLENNGNDFEAFKTAAKKALNL